MSHQIIFDEYEPTSIELNQRCKCLNRLRYGSISKHEHAREDKFNPQNYDSRWHRTSYYSGDKIVGFPVSIILLEILPSILSTAKRDITLFNKNTQNSDEFDDHNTYDCTEESECS